MGYLQIIETLHGIKEEIHMKPWTKFQEATAGSGEDWLIFQGVDMIERNLDFVSQGVDTIEQTPHTFTEGTDTIEQTPHTFTNGADTIERYVEG